MNQPPLLLPDVAPATEALGKLGWPARRQTQVPKTLNENVSPCVLAGRHASLTVCRWPYADLFTAPPPAQHNLANV